MGLTGCKRGVGMNQSELRHARLRLARRRQGSKRVTAGGRGARLSRRSEGWRRIDWARWGTVVGVIAGVGSLAFTGIATYYGARVSADQLAQSQKTAEQTSRAQAAHVANWVDYDPRGGIQLHLMNRSPDPISYVEMMFTANVGDYNHNTLTVGYNVDLQGLAPCSELVFDASAWVYRVASGGREANPPIGAQLLARDGWKKQPGPYEVQVDYLTFADRDGQTWQRINGTLQRWKPFASDVSVQADEYGVGGILQNPQEKPVVACGDSSN